MRVGHENFLAVDFNAGPHKFAAAVRRFHARDFNGAECGFVKFNRFRRAFHNQAGDDGLIMRVIAHAYFLTSGDSRACRFDKPSAVTLWRAAPVAGLDHATDSAQIPVASAGWAGLGFAGRVGLA